MGKDGIEDSFAIDFERRDLWPDVSGVGGRGGGEGSQQALYGEAPPRGPTHFDRNGIFYVHLAFYWQMVPS